MRPTTKILMTVIGILLAMVVVLCFAWQDAKSEAKDALHELALAKANAETQKEKDQRALDRINDEHARAVITYKFQLEQAQLQYKVEINEVQAKYAAANYINEQLHNQVRVLNTNLANLSRPTIERYASTAGDSLAECSAFTGEVEQVARRYYSELNYLRSIWPKEIKNGFTVVDMKGNSKTYYTPIKIKAKAEDIEYVDTRPEEKPAEEPVEEQPEQL